MKKACSCLRRAADGSVLVLPAPDGGSETQAARFMIYLMTGVMPEGGVPRDMLTKRAVDCICHQIECVCPIAKPHKDKCSFRQAVLCAVGIECEHGYDVCPTCDPCTCKELP